MLAYLALGCFQQNGWLLAQAGCEKTFSGNDGEGGKNQKAYQVSFLAVLFPSLIFMGDNMKQLFPLKKLAGLGLWQYWVTAWTGLALCAGEEANEVPAI